MVDLPFVCVYNCMFFPILRCLVDRFAAVLPVCPTNGRLHKKCLYAFDSLVLQAISRSATAGARDRTRITLFSPVVKQFFRNQLKRESSVSTSNEGCQGFSKSSPLDQVQKSSREVCLCPNASFSNVKLLLQVSQHRGCSVCMAATRGERRLAPLELAFVSAALNSKTKRKQ